MKKIVIVWMVGLGFIFTAQAKTPVAQVTVRVTDDLGDVVTNVPVRVSTFKKWHRRDGSYGRDEYHNVTGITDTNGLVTLKIKSIRGSVSYAVVSTNDPHFNDPVKMNIEGVAYYRTISGKSYFTNAVSGKWQPWNPTVDLVIKRVLNPIPMYARFLKRSDTMFPAYNTPVGYDLVKADWLPPYGNGETPDFVFRLDCQLGEVTHDQVQYYDATLCLTFSNEGDGIQKYEAKPRQGSLLRLPRFAPESGYRPEWMQRAFNHIGSSHHEYDESQSYIYRVRTQEDEEGHIISALYGKIQGPISFSVLNFGAKLGMKYYLNPTPNDRNLEFDPEQNLFGGRDRFAP